MGFDEAIRRIGYLHSHAQVIEGVLSGLYDAGVAAFRAFQINHSRGLVAVPGSEFVSSPPVWVARAELQARVTQAIREALTSLHNEPWMLLLPDHSTGYALITRETFAAEEAGLNRMVALFPNKASRPSVSHSGSEKK